MNIEEVLNSEEGKTAVQKMVDEAVEGLKNKNNELIGKNKKEREQNESLQSQLEEINGKLSEYQKKQLEGETDVSKVREQLTTQHQKEIEKFQTELSTSKSTIEKLVIDNGLSDAITKANIAPHHIPAVKALIRTENKIAISDNEGIPSATVNGQGLHEFVKSWASGDVGKHYVSAGNNGGGGASGADKGSKGSGVKTISRSDFESMDSKVRSSFISDGGKVVDE